MTQSKDCTNLYNEGLLGALEKRREYFESLSGEELKTAQEFQEEIDEQLRKAGNQNNRMTIIHNMMMDYLKKMHSSSASLVDEMLDLSKKLTSFNKK